MTPNLHRISLTAVVLAVFLTGCSGGGGTSNSTKPDLERPPDSVPDSVVAEVSSCEFSWNGAAWKFKAGILLASTDGKSHSVDLSWEVTDAGGENIYASQDEYNIRLNPSTFLEVLTDAYPEKGIDINSSQFNEVQDELNGFVCRLTDLTYD